MRDVQKPGILRAPPSDAGGLKTARVESRLDFSSLAWWTCHADAFFLNPGSRAASCAVAPCSLSLQTRDDDRAARDRANYPPAVSVTAMLDRLYSSAEFDVGTLELTTTLALLLLLTSSVARSESAHACALGCRQNESNAVVTPAPRRLPKADGSQQPTEADIETLESVSAISKLREHSRAGRSFSIADHFQSLPSVLSPRDGRSRLIYVNAFRNIKSCPVARARLAVNISVLRNICVGAVTLRSRDASSRGSLNRQRMVQ